MIRSSVGRVPIIRDLVDLGRTSYLHNNIGSTLPDGSDPRFYQTKAYKDHVWVLLQGNRRDSSESMVLVGDQRYDVVYKSSFRN